MKNFLYILTLAILLTGCKEEVTNPINLVTGNADFSIYVAIGNSVTAGFQSNSLFEEGQINSYPNLIAKQVNTSFTQPIVSEPGIHQYRIVYRGLSPGGWFILEEEYDRGEITNADYPAPYNNLGIPGARLKDVLYTTNMFNTTSGINPFFDLILRNYNQNTGTQFQQAKKLKPTFLTLWIGNNDILGYAMGGAAGSEPSKEDFHTEYRELIDSIKTLNTEVLTANIPDVTVLPYFTAISVSDSGFQYYGETKSGVRKLEKDFDYITLPASKLIYDIYGKRTGKGLTQSDPLADKYVLDETEISNIRTIIMNFNNSIELLSSGAGFKVVDLHSVFNRLKESDINGGTNLNGITLKTDYVTGGLFSLDGIHPSNRGQGLIANEFIKVINQNYDASIPLINISQLPGQYFTKLALVP